MVTEWSTGSTDVVNDFSLSFEESRIGDQVICALHSEQPFFSIALAISRVGVLLTNCLITNFRLDSE